MSTNSSQRPNRRLAWRIAGLWMAVFALGLALVGVFLQYQHSEQLSQHLVDQTHRQASTIADNAHKDFNMQLDSAMRTTAEYQRTRFPDDVVYSGKWPKWIDWLEGWNGQSWTSLLDVEEHETVPADFIREHVATQPILPQSLSTPNPDLEYFDDREEPLVLAYFRTINRSGEATILVARINTFKLRTHLIEPMIAPGQGLILIDAPEQFNQEQSLYGPAKYWALDPSDFLRDQYSALILQLAANAVLTLIALGTLLAGLWYVLRLTRHEVALAELKSDFAANVSHELKTPLAVIRMYSETLYAGRVASEEKKQDYLSIIGRESTRLTNMINNILDFARIESGRTEYELEPTDVAEVVRDTYNTYREHLDHSGFEHELTIEDSLPRINADRDAIAQVLVNLISNAIKYSDDDKYLAIETTQDTRRNRRGVLISVHDRGIGIRAADQPLLFDGFFRAQDGRARKVGGAGLGLALVKHIVDAHHGSVSVESRLVKGTTFRVFLPASEKETAAEAVAQPNVALRSEFEVQEGAEADSRSPVGGAAET